MLALSNAVIPPKAAPSIRPRFVRGHDEPDARAHRGLPWPRARSRRRAL